MALTTNLVAYYDLDEASGNAIDAVGSNDLTDNNTVGSATDARDFELSSSQYFSHADNTDFSIGDVDCAFSALITIEAKNGVSQTILSKNSAGDFDYYLHYDASTDRLRFLVFSGSGGVGGTGVKADNLGSPATGTTYFVFAWHDAANDQIGIRINNGTADTASFSGGIHDSTGDFFIGGESSAAQYWDGTIAKVGFWKGGFPDSTDQTTLYNSGAGLKYADFAGGSSASEGTLSVTLADATLSAEGANPNADISGTLSATLADATLSSAAELQTGTITTGALKNNTGTVLASTTIDMVAALSLTDLSVIASWTDQDTDTDGILTLVDASLVSGTSYLVVTSNSDGTAAGVRVYEASLS